MALPTTMSEPGCNDCKEDLAKNQVKGGEAVSNAASSQPCNSKTSGKKSVISKQHNPEEYNNTKKRPLVDGEVVLQAHPGGLKRTSDKNQQSLLKKEDVYNLTNLCSPPIGKSNEMLGVSERYTDTRMANKNSTVKHSTVLENNTSKFNNSHGSVNKCVECKEPQMSNKSDFSVDLKIHSSFKVENGQNDDKESNRALEKTVCKRSRISDNYCKSRSPHSKDRTRIDGYKQENCTVDRLKPYNESSRRDRESNSKKYSYHSSTFCEKEESDHKRRRYDHCRRERYRDQEGYYSDRHRRWDGYGYLNNYYPSSGSRGGRRLLHNDRDYENPFYSSRPFNDFNSKNRWINESTNKDKERSYFSSSKLDLYPASPYYSVKCQPGHTSFPEVKSCINQPSWQNNRKRKYENSPEDTGSNSDEEKKHRKSFQDEPYENRWRKHKTSKKKKKYRDDYTDSDVSASYSDSDAHRHKKKRKKKHEKKWVNYNETDLKY